MKTSELCSVAQCSVGGEFSTRSQACYIGCKFSNPTDKVKRKIAGNQAQPDRGQKAGRYAWP